MQSQQAAFLLCRSTTVYHCTIGTQGMAVQHFFQVIILASMSDAIYYSPPKLFRNIVPQLCRHPPTWPGQFGSVCMRVVFYTAAVEHVQALHHSGRPTSSTDNRLKHSSAITNSPSVCQEDGIGSRYQVSERELRVASAWNTHQDSVWLHHNLSIVSSKDFDDC